MQRAELAVADRASKYRRLAWELKSAKDELIQKVAVAKVKAKEAKVREANVAVAVEVAKAEVATMKAEVASEKAKAAAIKTEVASSQGEVLHAFAERLFLSGKFSELVTKLAAILNIVVTSDVIYEIAKDYLDLDMR